MLLYANTLPYENDLTLHILHEGVEFSAGKIYCEVFLSDFIKTTSAPNVCACE